MLSILLTQCVVCLINAPCKTNLSWETENLLLQSMHTNTQAHTTRSSHVWYALEMCLLIIRNTGLHTAACQLPVVQHVCMYCMCMPSLHMCGDLFANKQHQVFCQCVENNITTFLCVTVPTVYYSCVCR